MSPNCNDVFRCFVVVTTQMVLNICSVRSQCSAADHPEIKHGENRSIATAKPFSIAGSGESDPNGAVGYFPGCIDFLDSFLEVGASFHPAGDAAIKLLNAAGVKPRIMGLQC